MTLCAFCEPGFLEGPNMSRQFKTPRRSQRTSRDLRKHVQNCKHEKTCLHFRKINLSSGIFFFTFSLINFDLQSFNAWSVQVSTAARSPDTAPPGNLSAERFRQFTSGTGCVKLVKHVQTVVFLILFQVVLACCESHSGGYRQRHSNHGMTTLLS